MSIQQSSYYPISQAPNDVEITASGSTTARTLPERFSEIINVQDYGAIGDGVTSDSAAIQASFNACPIGGCVYFPPTAGGYRITTTVNLYQATGVANRKKNITFLGHNTKICLVHSNPTTDLATTMFEVRNTEGMKFEGLHFDGGHAYVPFAQGTTLASGYFSGYGTPLLKFRTISGFSSSEICNNCSVFKCKFTNGRIVAIGFYDSDISYQNFTVESCHFENLEGGIQSNPTAPKNFTISNCQFINGQCRQWLDSSIWGGTRDVEHQGYFGFNSSAAINIRIDSSSVTAADAADPERATSARLIVSNNTIDNWGHQGMELIGFKNVSITGNSISRVAYGISVAHRFNNLRPDGISYSCSGNSFRGNLFYDIEFGGSGSAIVGNTFDGRAIYSDSDGRTLCDYGIILYSPDNGKYSKIYNSEGFGNTISGNVFIAHRFNNIQFRSAVNTTVTGNIFNSRRSATNLELNYGCRNVTIDGNSFVASPYEVDDFVSYNKTNTGIGVAVGSAPISASISRSASTATVVCSEVHNLSSGDLFTIAGATQSEYNITGVVLSSGLTSTQFQYAIVGSPATPATGSPFVFVNPISVDITGITQSSLVATAITAVPHKLVEGERSVIWGANQNEYNGLIIVDEIVNSTTFKYVITGNPATATGTLKLGLMPRFNTSGLVISSNTFEGNYATSAIYFYNDPSGSTSGKQCLSNVKIVNNTQNPVAGVGGISFLNNGGGTFRNVDIRGNSGGLSSANGLGLRYNQKDVPNIPNAAPSWKPRWIGDQYFNSSSGVMYLAIGTSSFSDWKALTFA